MFGVFTFTLTHFLAKTIFPEGIGGVQNSNENSEGVGGLFWWSKMEIPRRRGGLREIPPMVGVFSGTTQYEKPRIKRHVGVFSILNSKRRLLAELVQVVRLSTQDQLNGPFATNDHMVQNPPCWRASSLLTVCHRQAVLAGGSGFFL